MPENFVRSKAISNEEQSRVPPLPGNSLDLSGLTEQEEKLIRAVIQKDEAERNILDAKISEVRREIQEIRKAGALTAGDDQNAICARCKYKFPPFVFPWADRGERCGTCKFRICKACGKKETNGSWICTLCLKYRQEKLLTGEWMSRGQTVGLQGSDLVRASLRDKRQEQAGYDEMDGCTYTYTQKPAKAKDVDSESRTSKNSSDDDNDTAFSKNQINENPKRDALSHTTIRGFRTGPNHRMVLSSSAPSLQHSTFRERGRARFPRNETINYSRAVAQAQHARKTAAENSAARSPLAPASHTPPPSRTNYLGGGVTPQGETDYSTDDGSSCVSVDMGEGSFLCDSGVSSTNPPGSGCFTTNNSIGVGEGSPVGIPSHSPSSSSGPPHQLPLPPPHESSDPSLSPGELYRHSSLCKSNSNSISDQTLYYDDVKLASPSLSGLSTPDSRSCSSLGSDYGLNPKYKSLKPATGTSELELFRKRGERYSLRKKKAALDKEKQDQDDLENERSTNTKRTRKISVHTNNQWIPHWHEHLRRQSVVDMSPKQFRHITAQQSLPSPLLNVTPPAEENDLFAKVRPKSSSPEPNTLHSPSHLSPYDSKSRKDSSSSQESISAYVIAAKAAKSERNSDDERIENKNDPLSLSTTVYSFKSPDLSGPVRAESVPNFLTSSPKLNKNSKELKQLLDQKTESMVQTGRPSSQSKESLAETSLPIESSGLFKQGRDNSGPLKTCKSALETSESLHQKFQTPHWDSQEFLPQNSPDRTLEPQTLPTLEMKPQKWTSPILQSQNSQYQSSILPKSPLQVLEPQSSESIKSSSPKVSSSTSLARGNSLNVPRPRFRRTGFGASLPRALAPFKDGRRRKLPDYGKKEILAERNDEREVGNGDKVNEGQGQRRDSYSRALENQKVTVILPKGNTNFARVAPREDKDVPRPRHAKTDIESLDLGKDRESDASSVASYSDTHTPSSSTNNDASSEDTKSMSGQSLHDEPYDQEQSVTKTSTPRRPAPAIPDKFRFRKRTNSVDSESQKSESIDSESIHSESEASGAVCDVEEKNYAPTTIVPKEADTKMTEHEAEEPPVFSDEDGPPLEPQVVESTQTPEVDSQPREKPKSQKKGPAEEDSFEEIYNSNVNRLVEMMTGGAAQTPGHETATAKRELPKTPAHGKSNEFLLQKSLSLSEELAENMKYASFDEVIEETKNKKKEEDSPNEELILSSEAKNRQRVQDTTYNPRTPKPGDPYVKEESPSVKMSKNTLEHNKITGERQNSRPISAEKQPKGESKTPQPSKSILSIVKGKQQTSQSQPQEEEENEPTGILEKLERKFLKPLLKKSHPPEVQQQLEDINKARDGGVPENFKVNLHRTGSVVSDSLSIITEMSETCGEAESLPNNGDDSDDTIGDGSFEDSFSDDEEVVDELKGSVMNILEAMAKAEDEAMDLAQQNHSEGPSDSHSTDQSEDPGKAFIESSRNLAMRHEEKSDDLAVSEVSLENSRCSTSLSSAVEDSNPESYFTNREPSISSQISDLDSEKDMKDSEDSAVSGESTESRRDMRLKQEVSAIGNRTMWSDIVKEPSSEENFIHNENGKLVTEEEYLADVDKGMPLTEGPGNRITDHTKHPHTQVAAISSSTDTTQPHREADLGTPLDKTQRAANDDDQPSISSSVFSRGIAKAKKKVNGMKSSKKSPEDKEDTKDSEEKKPSKPSRKKTPKKKPTLLSLALQRQKELEQEARQQEKEEKREMKTRLAESQQSHEDLPDATYDLDDDDEGDSSSFSEESVRDSDSGVNSGHTSRTNTPEQRSQQHKGESKQLAVPAIAVTNSGDEKSKEEDDDIDELFNHHRPNMLGSRSSLADSRESVYSVYSDAGEVNYGRIPVTGEILFNLSYNYKSNILEVHIKQCKDLAPVDTKHNRSDPYVKTYLLPDKSRSSKRKSKIKKHTLNPNFDETLKYPIGKTELESRSLWVTVWHNDRFGRNDFLGEVTIPLDYYRFDDNTPRWYPLQERTVAEESMMLYKGDLFISLKYVPADMVEGTPKKKSSSFRKKSKEKTPPAAAGEVHVLVREAQNLTAMRGSSGSNPFCKGYLLPDVSHSSKQKTPVIKKTTNPQWQHILVFEGVEESKLQDHGLELTVWDNEKLSSNDFLGGVRLNLGQGVHQDKLVDWMDARGEEIDAWQTMMEHPNEWVDIQLPLRASMGKQVVKK